MRRRHTAAVVLLLGAATVPAGAAPALADDAPLRGHRLFRFADEALHESSGLVDRGAVVWTTNDSGDAAVLYGVDARSGQTVRRVAYAAAVEDVESLAPGADGTIWAGDTGDNQRSRGHISIYRVRPRDGQQRAPQTVLTYPDGAHDAETLLVQPRTQRLFVVSKSVFGGTVYAAPRRVRTGGSPNRMRTFAHVGGLVTDGTFFPDGKHVLLRTYGNASVYTFPGFALVGSVTLPSQPQGEGISVSATGRVLVSSEGVHSAVLQVRLPRSLTQPRQPARHSSSGSPMRTGVVADTSGRDPGDWIAFGVIAAGALGAAGWAARRVARRR